MYCIYMYVLASNRGLHIIDDLSRWAGLRGGVKSCRRKLKFAASIIITFYCSFTERRLSTTTPDSRRHPSTTTLRWRARSSRSRETRWAVARNADRSAAVALTFVHCETARPSVHAFYTPATCRSDGQYLHRIICAEVLCACSEVCESLTSWNISHGTDVYAPVRSCGSWRYIAGEELA